MEASRSARERTAADTTLSRKLADFLVELSIALHKRSIYPAGHPYLRASVDRFADRVATLLESREVITIGVARDRLVIESATTDPANALLRDLAHRLHRHQLSSIGFTRGASLAEIEELLAALGADPERDGGPLGRRLGATTDWPHIALRSAGYDRLTLEDDGAPDGQSGGEAGGRDFWLALAQAALAAEERGDAPPTTEDDELIITAGDREGRHAAYDSVVRGYLSQVAEEQSGRAGVGEAQLRRRVSRLLNALDPESLRQLLATDADLSARQQPLLSASQTLAVDAVAEVLEAAAKTPHRSISHNLLALLHKLAHRSSGAAVQSEPDSALRRNVARLISGWELDDPNPADYTGILQGMVREMPVVGLYQSDARCDAEVIIRMAVEVDAIGPAAIAAARALAEDGRLTALAGILEPAPDGVPARAIWPLIATEERLRAALEREPPDHATIAVLVAHVGAPAVAPLLDALERAVTRSNRAAILKHVATLGPACAPAAAARLPGAPWYLKRNILVLIGQWGTWPDGFTPLPYAADPDVRVRREATKLLLASDEHRPRIIAAALGDGDTAIVTQALSAAIESCPADALPLVRRIATGTGRDAALRAQAIRVLARAGGAEDLEILVTLARARRRWLRQRLAPRSPAMLAAIAGLAQRWPHEPRAAAVLRDATHHHDLQIRIAAGASA
jgi:hypothetical protein